MCLCWRVPIHLDGMSRSSKSGKPPYHIPCREADTLTLYCENYMVTIKHIENRGNGNFKRHGNLGFMNSESLCEVFRGTVCWLTRGTTRNQAGSTNVPVLAPILSSQDYCFSVVSYLSDLIPSLSLRQWDWASCEEIEMSDLRSFR